MSILVEKLAPEAETAYEKFIRSSPSALFFHSLGYRNLLRKFLGAEDHYLIARETDGEIIGVLPLFIKSAPGKGMVVNSLPFYGSHGGVVCAEGRDDVEHSLLKRYRTFLDENDFISSTIISSPFDRNLTKYKNLTKATLFDSRIGQLTPLPEEGENAGLSVMAALHSKTRNMVRKAEKLGVVAESDYQNDAIGFLSATHQENMLEIGGLAKPEHFFNLVEEMFEYGIDYRIYVATLNGKPIASLLLFYFNGMVEYFTPVILKGHRSDQPMSLLIFTAMKDSVEMGYKWWNWGGTWHTQDGVYKFKRSWGAVDMPYCYFTTLQDDTILTRSREELLCDFPYFYVIPFSKLKT